MPFEYSEATWGLKVELAQMRDSKANLEKEDGGESICLACSRPGFDPQRPVGSPKPARSTFCAQSQE